MSPLLAKAFSYQREGQLMKAGIELAKLMDKERESLLETFVPEHWEPIVSIGFLSYANTCGFRYDERYQTLKRKIVARLSKVWDNKKIDDALRGL